MTEKQIRAALAVRLQNLAHAVHTAKKPVPLAEAISRMNQIVIDVLLVSRVQPKIAPSSDD